MLPKGNAGKEVSQKFSAYLPAFQDIFDEESFYIFAFCLTLVAFIFAFVASRYVKIKDAGHLD
ncbi:unnamed protein product [Lymnaea stagnalis]|uniref:Uncharacterized protein n=1 Tax=Lymnaea stagnalis TaxID=6523 RepID=A0AAV2IJK0_LYMST